MDSILDYFISLQESEPAELPERAIERWNKRADFWEEARKKKNVLENREILDFFQDFYTDFSRERAEEMLKSLGIDPAVKMRTLSKGTKEKVQLILVMSRNASLYILDEPIAGVDPAARDYILRTIINNYNPEATVLISTHLIEDVEQVLDEVIFMRYGQLVLYTSVDNIREEKGKSVDAYFREVFAC